MTVRQRDGGQAFAGGTTCWQGGESQEGLCPPAPDLCLFHPPNEKNSQKIVRNLGSQKNMRILLFLGFGLQGHQSQRIVKNLIQKK